MFHVTIMLDHGKILYIHRVNPNASALYGRVKLLKADILSEIPRVLHPKITDHIVTSHYIWFFTNKTGDFLLNSHKMFSNEQ